MNVSQAGGKAKKAKKDDDEEGADGVAIDMSQHVSLTFSLKYLANFSESASLSDTVQLHMSNDVPLLVCHCALLCALKHDNNSQVEHQFGSGHIKYFKAPKIGDE